MQDASILVNYDLPWTVLQLAQRMGRVLRPWGDPRDVIIYNFVLSTMNHKRIRHARNWEHRLQERSRQHRSLAQIPVMVNRESQQSGMTRGLEMEKLGREMYLASDDRADLDLEQVMEFLQRVEDLTTSTFYNDLAIISNQNEILKLPAGIRSAMNKSGRKRLFLLLRRGRNRIDTIIADAHGNPLEESNRRDDVMRIIRCLPETAKSSFESYPQEDEFDIWLERAHRYWAEQNGLEQAKLQVICVLDLVL